MTPAEAKELLVKDLGYENIKKIEYKGKSDDEFLFRCYYEKPVIDFHNNIRDFFDVVVDEDNEVLVLPK